MTGIITQLVNDSSPNDPDHGYDVISTAGYYGPASTAPYNAQTTAQQIESDVTSYLTTTYESKLQSFMDMANQWSEKLGRTIPTIMYEAGWALRRSNDCILV